MSDQAFTNEERIVRYVHGTVRSCIVSPTTYPTQSVGARAPWHQSPPVCDTPQTFALGECTCTTFCKLEIRGNSCRTFCKLPPMHSCMGAARRHRGTCMAIWCWDPRTVTLGCQHVCSHRLIRSFYVHGRESDPRFAKYYMANHCVNMKGVSARLRYPPAGMPIAPPANKEPATQHNAQFGRLVAVKSVAERVWLPVVLRPRRRRRVAHVAA